jgi:mono/diheme cytochrome c family protein
MSAGLPLATATKIARSSCVLVLVGAAGCLGSALTGTGSGSGGGAGGTNGGSDGSASTIGDGGTAASPPDLAPDLVGLFYANVAPIINAACAGCHGVAGGAGPAFMMPKPDLLQNLLAYPGIVGSTPEKSRLYMKGAHEGPAFTPAQAMTVHDWIALFDSLRPADAGAGRPSVAPFAPSMTALNTVDLAAFDPSLAGQKLTFNAKLLGTSIELSNINVVTSPTLGVHIAHPLFVMWDPNLNPTPDPIDSFSNVDETVPSSSTQPLGPGTLVMPNFPSNGLINVVFTTVETKMVAGGDGGAVSGCKSVASFTSNVVPQVTGNNGALSLNCSGCHGAQGNAAANVWDIVNVANSAATACASTLGEINTTTPAMSKLFAKVDPNSATPHQGGKLAAGQLSGFASAITTWINLEK